MMPGETIVVTLSAFDQDEAVELIEGALSEAGILAEVEKR